MSAFTREEIRNQQQMLATMKAREAVHRVLAPTPAPIWAHDPIATADAAHAEFDRADRTQRREARTVAVTLSALALAFSGIGYAAVCVSGVL